LNLEISKVIVSAVLVLFAAVAPRAAVAQNMAEGHTVEVNGIEIYYEVVGEGEPLVLLHSFSNSGRIFDPFVEAFAGQYRLIVPDLRGHGGSTNPGGEFTMRQSALAQYDADNFPEAGWNRLRQVHKHGDEQIRNLIKALAGFAESHDDLTFTPPALATIAARTLFVHGDRDYCFPVSMVEEMYTAVPKSYLWIVPNGGHVPIYGRWQSPFTETVMEFLNGGWEEG
jgi:pimeloyl-ACP methyl ester carboxylesterase